MREDGTHVSMSDPVTTPGADHPAHEARGRGSRRRFIVWLVIAVALCVFVLVVPQLLTTDPLATDLSQVNLPPSAQHLLGTDSVGRDIAVRILAGGRTTVFASLAVVALSFAIGVTVGTLSGYFGGVVDAVCMRVVDAFLAFPSVIFAIVVVGLLGGGLMNAIIAMTVVGWAKFARLARGQVLSLKGRTFVVAERVGGLSAARIGLRHLLPNILQPLVVTACLEIGNMMLGLAGLSFLGLGAAPPAPEWGSMLNQGSKLVQSAPWAVFAPGAAILVTVMVMNMLGDSANDYFEQKRNSR